MDTTFSHIKAVFCDIDGTLLTSQHTVSPRTVAAIRALRERGVLIVGSGNVVHNLRAVRRDAPNDATYDWGAAFDDKVKTHVVDGNLGGLVDFQQWGAIAQQAHPTYEHYLPLLYAAGAVHPGETPRFFNTGFQLASISMRSMLWG